MIWNLESKPPLTVHSGKRYRSSGCEDFSEIVRKLPENEVTIETDAKLNTTITCEKAKFNIPG